MKTPRQILIEKARSYREDADEIEEIQYANRKDELGRIIKARKDENTIRQLRSELKKGDK